jgi:CRP-like cAMP-binding protein
MDAALRQAGTGRSDSGAWMALVADRPGARSPLQNQLLAVLPEEVRLRLFPHLELAMLPLRAVLHEAGALQRHIYFPIDAVVSLLHLTECGGSVQVSMVGCEGLVGDALLPGSNCAPHWAVVQNSGYAFRIAAPRLKHEFNRHEAMMKLALRFTLSLMAQIAQTAVCNRHHSIDQQLCRWLLLTLDRLPGSRLDVTQELIAGMLGVRREGVTSATLKLQNLGIIKHERGHVTVVDRQKLAKLSCECYGVIRQESDRLLPRAPGHAERPRGLSAVAGQRNLAPAGGGGPASITL